MKTSISIVIKEAAQRLHQLSALFALAVLCCSHAAHGQQNKGDDGPMIEIVTQRATDLPSQAIRILGKGGKAMGSYTILHQADHTQKYQVNLRNGTSLEVEAKDQVYLAEGADRIVVFGDDLFRHVRYYADFRMYNSTGQLIKSEENIASMPYAAALGDDGTFYLSGKRGETPAEAHNVFVKYDKSGNKQWEKKLPMGIPSRIYISDDHQKIALVRFDEHSMKHTVSYFSASGTLLHEDETHASFSGLEFLSNGKVVVVCGMEYFLYDLTSGYTLVKRGILSGNGIGNYPATDLTTQNSFVVVSVAYPETNSGFNVSLYDATTGVKLTETVIDGQPYYSPYRIASVLDNGNISLDLGIEEIEISIEN